MYPPSGGSPRADQAQEGRYLPELTPERLLKDRSIANNPQTRLGAYHRKTIGLQIPPSTPGTAELFVTMGVNPPKREVGSEPDPR